MEETKEVSNIQDEDVLRRMWQSSEDASRKKEIRAHMYKLREARLKEFYSSGEVLRDVQRSNSSPGLRDQQQQPCNKDQGPTHADSLADHSFMSLKTKEVRDSESPTRDVQYRNSKNRDVDGQWTITSSSSTSPDGKSFTSSQRATTQGMRPVDGGQLTYAAENEHQASVFTDGDDRNFTRSVGEASKTFAEENIVSGDDNNFRKSKTTSKSTSSRVVTEHRSQSGDFPDQQLAITAADEVDNTAFNKNTKKTTNIVSGDDNNFRNSKTTSKSTSSRVVTEHRSQSGDFPDQQLDEVDNTAFNKNTKKTTYTSGEIPDDLKKSIADGSTKVFTETKTLPDGSTVTTTRYETRSTKKVGATDTRSKTTTSVDRQNVTDGNYKTVVTKTIQEPTVSKSSHVTSSRHTVQEYDTNIDDGSYHTVEVDTKPSRTVQEYDTNIDKTIVTKITREPTVSTKTSSRQTVQTDNTQNVDDTNANYKTVVTKTVREVDTYPTETFEVTSNRQVVHKSTDNSTDKTNYKTVATKTIRETDFDDRQNVKQTENKNVTTTIVREVDDHRRPVVTKSVVESPTVETIVTKTTVTETKKPDSPTKSSPKQSAPPKSCKPQESYHPSSPTEGQYSTTYRSEFTNKKISVDVSATHDAFARSLRSISPDRLTERPKSRGSISSLRSSTSPEKHSERRSPDRKHNVSPCRQSPERKQYSPERKQYSPERKQYSPERKQYSPERKQYSPERKQYSPERKPSRPDSITVTRTTETITKRRGSDKKSPTSPVKTSVSITKSPTKSPVSPTKDYPTTAKSPVSPTKDSPKKKQPPTDDERKSPVRSPNKTTEINTDTITRKKKLPTDENKSPDDRRSPVKYTTVDSTTITRNKNTPSTIEITINSDTITRKQKTPTDGLKSPNKTCTTEIINTDTITRNKKKPETNVDTIPRKQKPEKVTTDIDEQIVTETTETKHSISRDLSQTSLASDIEFINHNRHIVTDLDEPLDDKPGRKEKRPSTLEVTETVVTSTKVTSPTKSPVKSKSPTKEHPKGHPTSPVKEIPTLKKNPVPELSSPDKPPTNFNIEDFDQVCEVTPKERPPLRRTETYEERCRQMLGLPEPDEIIKKDYDDMYAGMEPVEEPLFVKKNVTPLGPIGPDDYVIHDSVKKINKRKEEIPDDVKDNIEEFIIKEQIEIVDAKPRDNKKSPERKSPEKSSAERKFPDQKVTKSPVHKSASPDRKSPRNKLPTDGQYNTEYTDEYCDRPTRVTTTKTIKITDRKPSRESSPTKTIDTLDKKPKDVSPKKDTTTKTPKVTSRESSPKKDYTTTRTIDSPTKTTKVTDRKPSREIITTTKTTKVTDTKVNEYNKSPRRPSKGSPERKPKQEFTTEYTEEYCEITDKKVTSKPGKQPTVRGTPSPKKTQKPVDSSDDEQPKKKTDRYSPSRTLPENVTVTQYINNTKHDDDFISKEKHDTDINLTTRDIEFNLETENVQETHVRTHRIDTKPREISPKRVPQKAVPSDTIECTFKKPDTKKTPVTDRKSPVKQLKDKKDSCTKIVTTTKTVTKKVSSSDLPVSRTTPKKSPEIQKKPSSTSITRKPSDNPQKTVPKTNSVPSKHIVTKTISVKTKPSTKPATKSVTKPKDNDTSDSEAEIEIIKKKVTNGNVNVTLPSYKVNTTEKTKCVTTKSIILNNEPDLDTEIDLQRSTSSREPSPHKICPIPVSDDEESHPRYPDQVSEPDDVPFKRPTKISDIPLTEEENVDDFNRITEVKKKTTDIDMVTETDESLLSVTEKVTKFITTSEKLIENKPKPPAPRVPRPQLVVDEHLENDECLLSVSDKVSKFITTAEQIQTPERPKSPRPKSPRPKDRSPVDVKVNENDECLLSVNEKVSHFITAAETSKKTPSRDGPAPKVARPDFKVDETLKTDECLLSVSDKVNKFLTSAEKLTNKTEITVTRQSPERTTPTSNRREPTPSRRDSTPSDTTPTRQKSPEKITPKREPSPIKKTPDLVIKTPDLVRKTPDLVRKSPEKTPELLRKSPERSPEQLRKSPERTPDLVRKFPTSEPKSVNLKSSEAVKKAKAMFENISKTQEAPKQRDILSRPSIWEGRKKPEVVDKPEDDVKLTDIGVYTLKSTKLILNESKPQTTRYLSPEKDIPGYMRPTRARSPNPTCKPEPEPVQKPEHHIQKPEESIQRSRSPANPDLPGYMRPIAKVSPKERDQIILETRYRETISPEREIVKKSVVETEIELTTQKRVQEHVEVPHYMLPLQRNASPERRIVETVEIIETPVEISPKEVPKDLPGYMRPLQRHNHSPERTTEVVDESRAEKKFGVTLRRTDSGRMVNVTTERRRSSAGVVNGQTNIEEIEDLEVLEKMMDKVVGYEQRRRIRSQIRVVKKLISDNKITKTRKVVSKSPVREQFVQKPCEDRRSPTREPKRSSISPSKTTGTPMRQASPDPKQKTSSTYTSVTTTRTTKERSVSPDNKKKSPVSPNMYKPDLKKTQPTAKTTIVIEDKPSWATNRNLKKTTENTEKRTVTNVTQSKKIENVVRRSPSPQKDAKPTDCITSSYGIGPTDENGLPLFGIRALRKAADTKVQIKGTVVTSQFYSENGQEPVGEVTVTKYSNNPKELNIDDEQINKTKGIASITTTQKFGSRGTPPLSSLVDKKKAITDKEEDEILKTTSSKVTRRGSVKALSQKFIENAVESIQKEKQNYPKAGLILRTSSFKETTNNDRNSSSRESSPGYSPRPGKVSLDSITSDSRSTIQSSTEQSRTFLNSHTKVANAQEVITRMRNAENEHQEGDSAEDREARMLLNKFLGAQVLMSGMEPLLSTQSTTVSSSTSSSSAQLVRKVQKKTVTSSSKETSKPLSLTKRYQTPITPEILQDIWDEQTLRALLEQCTDYEERRAIRARLRQVMAEQEAVANVVASAVSDSTSQERFETTKSTFSEGPVTTTQVSTTRVVQQSRQVSKPMSPFAKFRQLDKQNSLNTPPSSPRTPTGTGGPMFKFTDPALSQSASTVKERLLHWAQMKTKEYQNIKLDNFSTSWADGMAFCALIHHFLPDAFDYHALNPKQRRHNFTLAFKVADEQADIAPLLDVDDMVAMRRPDWKCVFTYVQSIYRRFKDED